MPASALAPPLPTWPPPPALLPPLPPVLDPLDPPLVVIVPALPPELDVPPEPIGDPPALGLAAPPCVSLPHAPHSATQEAVIISRCVLRRREIATRRRSCSTRLDETDEVIRVT